MDETGAGYPTGSNDSNDWDRRERWRDYQRHRVIHADVADGYLQLAREAVHGLGRDSRRAVRLLAKAACAYQGAGMVYRARIAWRYARVLHRASTAGVGR